MNTDLKILLDWITDDFPNNNEWYKDGYETFIFYAGKFLEKGFTIDEIKEILSDLYSAVSQEYGD